MYDFLIYMLVFFLFIVSTLSYGFLMYVGFDVRKRLTGEPYERGLNITMSKLKEEYRIADEWWRNR